MGAKRDRNVNSEDVTADKDAGGGEECNCSEDNDLFHVYGCVCLCWRKAPPSALTVQRYFPLTHSLFISLSLSPQIDLEPEGKVYVVIDLSGSSTEGKNTSTLRFTGDQDTSEHMGLCFEVTPH